MIIALIAVDTAGGIGYKGSMPWPHNKDDMQWFKTLTQNHVVVMGRKTWNSPDMPSPLPGRHNVLFTNTFIERNDIDQIRGDACDALKAIQKNHKNKSIFIIGGVDLLTQSQPVLQKIFITRIPGEYLSDTKIDLDKFLNGFTLINTIDLGSCIVEEYQNEKLQARARTRSAKRNTEV
jgi:dihydrofolate reductase